MIMPTHLRVKVTVECDKYACGTKTNRDVQLSSCVNPYGVTCYNCKRTKAFKDAMKAAG